MFDNTIDNIQIKNRNNTLDLMKGILVVFMIAAHLINFVAIGEIGFIIEIFVNFIAFSGFMFCFGYVCTIAYSNKKADFNLLKKLCKRMIFTIIAYYISSIAFTIFVSHDYNIINYLKILAFIKIPDFSEFLLSFAFLYPLIFILALFKDKIKLAYLIIIIAISLILTNIDYSIIRIPILGVFVGSDLYGCFPIVQYISLFIFGMFLSMYGKRCKIPFLIISIISLILLAFYVFINKKLPERFPPSILFIIGGYPFVFLLYFLCNKFSNNLIKFKLIFEVGKHTLPFLVISNIMIFLITNFRKYFLHIKIYRFIAFVLIYILCFVFSFFWVKISKSIKESRIKKVNNTK